MALLDRLKRRWRDRKEGACPWCGKKRTFGPDGKNDVCSNCGFDFRKDPY